MWSVDVGLMSVAPEVNAIYQGLISLNKRCSYELLRFKFMVSNSLQHPHIHLDDAFYREILGGQAPCSLYCICSKKCRIQDSQGGHVF